MRKYAKMFCWKNVSSFCSAKATHICTAKNIRILYIESAKTVNEMTLNELVKQTMLWTTGPRSKQHDSLGIMGHLFLSVCLSVCLFFLFNNTNGIITANTFRDYSNNCGYVSQIFPFTMSSNVLSIKTNTSSKLTWIIKRLMVGHAIFPITISSMTIIFRVMFLEHCGARTENMLVSLHDNTVWLMAPLRH